MVHNCVMNVEFHTSFHALLQYHLPMPISLLRADNNLPPWRPGLKEVIFCELYLSIKICFFPFNLFSRFTITDLGTNAHFFLIATNAFDCGINIAVTCLIALQVNYNQHNMLFDLIV